MAQVHQKTRRTGKCSAIVLLIKYFVQRRSSFRRGFLNISSLLRDPRRRENVVRTSVTHWAVTSCATLKRSSEFSEAGDSRRIFLSFQESQFEAKRKVAKAERALLLCSRTILKILHFGE